MHVSVHVSIDHQPSGDLQILGFISRSHSIWVCRDPELQIVLPSPLATKYSLSSAVAPVMAKLAP
jgi:hypothetical protein